MHSSTIAKAAARATSTQGKRQSVLQQKRFVVGGAVLLLALAFLALNVAQGSMYYLTVGELLDRGAVAYGQQVRLGGLVVANSIQADQRSMTLRFTLTDGGAQVPVFYRGVVPDSFKPGGEVVMEGKLAQNGTFEASALLTKCLSFYSPAR